MSAAAARGHCTFPSDLKYAVTAREVYLKKLAFLRLSNVSVGGPLSRQVRIHLFTADFQLRVTHGPTRAS